ncbi:hypothetical protein Taro_021774, partial [Colocasia esculenta]|nr:hypothetical protein [Colocasia esculenta]
YSPLAASGTEDLICDTIDGSADSGSPVVAGRVRRCPAAPPRPVAGLQRARACRQLPDAVDAQLEFLRRIDAPGPSDRSFRPAAFISTLIRTIVPSAVARRADPARSDQGLCRRVPQMKNIVEDQQSQEKLLMEDVHAKTSEVHELEYKLEILKAVTEMVSYDERHTELYIEELNKGVEERRCDLLELESQW